MTIDGAVYEYVAKREVPRQGDDHQGGSSGDWVYVILEGRPRSRRRPQGLITLDTLKEGDIFGEMVFWLFPQSARSASIVADGRCA